MKWGAVLLRPPGGSFPGFDRTLASEPSVTRRSIRHVDWTDEGRLSVFYRVHAEDRSPVAAALDADESVRGFEVAGSNGSDHVVFVDAEASDLLGDLLAVVDTNSLVVEWPIECVEGGYRLSLVGTVDAVQEGFKAARAHVDVEIERLSTYEPARSGPLYALTDRQRAALRAAYDLGYYESPRKVSYADLAAELDCAQSTANDLLRRAEARLVAASLDG